LHSRTRYGTQRPPATSAFLPRPEQTCQSAGSLTAHGLPSGGWPELAQARVVLAVGCIGSATNPSLIGEPKRSDSSQNPATTACKSLSARRCGIAVLAQLRDS